MQPFWDESSHALGVAEMDATHQEFLERAAELWAAPDDEFPAGFFGLLEHTRRHFDVEGRLMRQSHFPALAEHEREHRRILAELSHLARRVELGRLSMARAYIEGMPTWFANHQVTMDAALAACL